MTDFDDRLDRAAQRMTIGAALELRDPRSATQPLRWVTPGHPQTDFWNAETAVAEAYLANVVAFRCVQIVANTIAALPFRAGPDPDDRTNWRRDAPLARLLGPAPGGPAPKLAARKLWAWTIAQRLVTGRHAWEIEYQGSRVAALWPLVSGNLKAIPTTSGSEWFKAFTYGRPDQPVRLTPDQVFYGWDPHPSDFRQPLSALEAARYDLSVARMADKHSVSFLRNGAVPAAVVITQEFPTERERRRFRSQWSATHGGPDNAGRTAFAEYAPGGNSQSFDIKTLGLSAKDARLVEQHRAALEMVAIDLGVPWSKLDASGRTFDNAEAEERTFWENTILPLVATLEDEVNMDLAPKIGTDAGWFDLSQVEELRPKPRFEVSLPELWDRGIVATNEIRGEVGLPPVDGGDERLDPTPVVREAPDPEQRAPEPPALPEPPQTVPVAPTVDHEQRRARLWRTTDRQARVLEARWEKAMARLFHRQEDATLRRLEGNRGRKVLKSDVRAPADEVFDPEYWRAQTSDEVEGLFEQVTSAALSDLAARFDVDFDLDDPMAREFILARSNELAGQVTDTTYRKIQEALVEGVAAGEGIPELAGRVREVFADAVGNRATVIARTEVISAYNASAMLGAQSLPSDVVAAAEWIATRDGRTRPAHASADGQIVPVGARFQVGGDDLAYPGDPSGRAGNTVQCRCTVAFLTRDEVEESFGGMAAISTWTADVTRSTAALRMVRAGDKIEPRVLRAVTEATHAA